MRRVAADALCAAASLMRHDDAMTMQRPAAVGLTNGDGAGSAAE
jgi:hypothetical protein